MGIRLSPEDEASLLAIPGVTIVSHTKLDGGQSIQKAGSEADFTRRVLLYAKAKGWRTLHLRPGMTRRGKWVTAVQGDGAGWPDLFLIRGPRIVVAELKVGRNKATESQLAWLKAFSEAGVENYLWTPEDWVQIVKVLE